MCIMPCCISQSSSGGNSGSKHRRLIERAYILTDSTMLGTQHIYPCRPSKSIMALGVLILLAYDGSWSPLSIRGFERVCGTAHQPLCFCVLEYI
jgi:hypothetical protein